MTSPPGALVLRAFCQEASIILLEPLDHPNDVSEVKIDALGHCAPLGARGECAHLAAAVPGDGGLDLGS